MSAQNLDNKAKILKPETKEQSSLDEYKAKEQEAKVNSSVKKSMLEESKSAEENMDNLGKLNDEICDKKSEDEFPNSERNVANEASAKLTQTMDKFKNNESAMNEEIEMLRKQISKDQEVLKNKEEEYQTAMHMIDLQTDMKQQLSEQNSKIEKLNAELNKKKQILSEKHAETKRYAGAIVGKRQEIIELQAKVKQFRNTEQIYLKKNTELKDSIGKHEELIKNREEEYQRTMIKLQTDTEEQLFEKDAELNKCTDELVQKRQEIIQLKAKMERFTDMKW
eukprot:731835_1